MQCIHVYDIVYMISLRKKQVKANAHPEENSENTELPWTGFELVLSARTDVTMYIYNASVRVHVYLHVFIALHVHVGHAVFRSHALLLRGSLHALWRMENDALRDLQEVINTQGLPAEVKEC